MLKNSLLSLLFVIPLVVYSHDGIDEQALHECRKYDQDTGVFHALKDRLLEEISLQSFLNLDTLRYYGDAVITTGKATMLSEDLIPVYLELGKCYLSKTHVEQAKYYYNLALGEAAAIKDLEFQAKAYAGYGYTLVYDNSNYDGAIYHMKQAYKIAELIGDTKLMLEYASKLVRIYGLLPKGYISALPNCIDLVKLSELRRDTFNLVDGYYMLASIYGDMDLHDKQMQMVYKSLALKDFVTDTATIYRINLTAAIGYLGAEQYDSVLYYARLNQPIAKAVNKYPSCLETLGKSFLEQNQLDSARYYYEEMLEVKKANSLYIDTYLYLDLGIIAFKSGQYQKALEYYKIAEADIDKPRLHTQVQILKALYEYYTFYKDDARALNYLQRYNHLEDSLSSKLTYITLMEAEGEKLHAEISLLQKDKELQATLTAKQEQEEGMLVGALAIIAAAAGLAFNRFRIQKNLKNKQTLLNERLRISRDLHDEVGSTLSGLAMYSHIAREQVRNLDNVRAENSLTIMQKSAGEMITKLSDIVWLINPERDTIAEMFQRLAEYARQMASAQNMQVRIDLPMSLSEMHIPLEARRNIYLFCKEAINNAVKYSNGTLIELQAKKVDGDLQFSVRDDGKGFDEMTIQRGNGLRNMRKRAEDIGAICRIGSRPQQGANIEMQYKLIQ